MKNLVKALCGVSIVAMPLAAWASDEQQFGFTVGSVTITKPISAGALGLKNMSSSKIASKRDLAVTGNNPRFTVTGQAFCKQGARLTAVQAIIGKGILHNNDMMVIQSWGKTAKDNSVAGRSDADVSLEVELKVSKRATDAAIDLTFNPAREYEQKLKAFVTKGGTAAEYLQETQAFDMNVTVNLVAWCKMDPNANSVLAGKTYAGFTARKVPVTILYNGDPAMTDGPAPRAKASTRKGSGGPPATTPPPVE
jgi:hypothetical protein